MQISEIPLGRLISFQAALVVVGSSIATHIIEAMDYRGIYNGIALLILISVVVVAFNRNVRLALFMFVSLILLTIFTMSLNIYVFGYFD
jgi:predicted MFS family arabinose efflux permease